MQTRDTPRESGPWSNSCFFMHMPQQTSATRSSPAPRRFGFWVLAYTPLWILLAAGGGWIFGAASVLLASALATALGLQPMRMRLGRLPLFVGFFLASSVSGAIDVARRALSPALPIEPSWERYQFASGDPRICLLLSAVVGLLPGTLAAKVEAGEMHLHVLDRRQPWRATVEQLELQLRSLFDDPTGSKERPP
ncbi:Na+/H+ antiporter subunit E [Gilvimarinus sp. F26214L]|uniref:Na+/H+ antiporter subunit E n=1 Tax=Gilvimarinus sp. DZF01 TaxID=3461371 RepID=UPI00404640EA